MLINSPSPEVINMFVWVLGSAPWRRDGGSSPCLLLSLRAGGCVWHIVGRVHPATP